jgi:hypothetical protein
MMKTFAIYYTSRYYSTKEYCQSIVRAKTEKSALRKFMKSCRDNCLVSGYEQRPDGTFEWWENLDWYNIFQGISEVDEITCPHCKGTGKVAVTHENVDVM